MRTSPAFSICTRHFNPVNHGNSCTFLNLTVTFSMFVTDNSADINSRK